MARLVRFKEDCDNFQANQVVSLDDGVADAYVTYRRTAVYHQDSVAPTTAKHVEAVRGRKFSALDKAVDSSEVATK
jgi:hypothetical protein